MRQTIAALVPATVLLALPDAALAAGGAKPAGGAAVGEVALATAGATVITLALFLLGWGHRSGRTQILRRPAEADGGS